MRKYSFILVLILIAGGFLFIYPEIEWSAPEINVQLDSRYVGIKPFDVEITDKGKGLKKASVIFRNADGETTLVDKTYPEGVKSDLVSVSIDPSATGLKGGEGELIVTAEDRSRLKIFSGNKSSVNMNVNLDLVPPTLSLISTEHYINHGGSGLVVYKASADTVKSGVFVGDNFFPGYKGYFPDEDVYLAFFAYPYNVEPDTAVTIIAEDQAGNDKTQSLSYRLKNIKYRKSDINISDNFLQNVVVPLSGDAAAGANPKEVFLQVNNKMRKENDARIREVGSDSKPEILWKGAFHQLSNSKVEANFADERTYFINGEPVDKQYHLGYDLAVTKRYPIEAANSGVIVYAGDLGIYGNAVIIDHGMGISTLYGHMSSIDVNVGDTVEKNQIIGRTGETGLAAGDHLHYGVYVNGIAVRPIEWWDLKWINDNVILKLTQAGAEFGSDKAENKKDTDKETEVE